MLAAPVPVFAVERALAQPGQWGVYNVTPAGGVGPLAAPLMPEREQAEAWARAFGRLADPCVEAA